MRSSLFLIALFLIGPVWVAAQDVRTNAYSMPNSEVRSLSSESNNIEYKLYVSLPEDYQDSEEDYPVLYLLDADYSFAIAKNIVDHLAERDHLQDVIVVGIAYAGENQYRLNRTRDYTPTNSGELVSFQQIQMEYSGGGPAFSKFIEGELIPFIEENYRVTKSRTLTGHSYGGLFTAWTLLTKPYLFDGYIIISPSLWYDDKLLFRLDEKLSSFPDRDIRVYLTVGEREINENWNMPQDLNEFVESLKNLNNQKLHIKKDIGVNETHNSIFPFGLSNGIRFVFEGI